MSTILEKANQILADKNTNLLPEYLKSGVTCLGVDGELISLEEGSADATATSRDIASGKTAYVNGEKVTGFVTELADSETDTVATVISTNEVGNVWIRQKVEADYLLRTTGSLVVTLPASDLASVIGLTADKIKAGETILGITGTYTGEEIITNPTLSELTLVGTKYGNEIGPTITDTASINFNIYGDAVINENNISLTGNSVMQSMGTIDLSGIYNEGRTYEIFTHWVNTAANAYPFAFGGFSEGFGLAFEDGDATKLRLYCMGNAVDIDAPLWSELLTGPALISLVVTSSTIICYLNGNEIASIENTIDLQNSDLSLHVNVNNEEDMVIQPMDQTVYGIYEYLGALDSMTIMEHFNEVSGGI